MIHNKTPFLAVAAAALIVLGASGGWIAGAAKSNPSSIEKTTDFWTETHKSVQMSSIGGSLTTIQTMKLPAGSWVLQAEQTVVNFDTPDYVGCNISDSTTSDLTAHRLYVGGAYPVMTDSETAAVVLTGPSTISIECEHDDTNGAEPYVDPNADLWAHRATSLSIQDTTS
jgi:hypothetical protein